MTTLETRRFLRLPRGVGEAPFIARERPVAEPVARQHDLGDDFARGEIAHQTLRPGVAERAVERAADLTGNAQRAAVGLGDVDALDVVGQPVELARQPDQPFARAVDRDLLGDDFRPRRGETLRQCCAQILGQRRHFRETLRAAHVEPLPDLLDAHALLALGHAGAAEDLREPGARQADQRRLRRRDITRQRLLLDEAARDGTFRQVQGEGGHKIIRTGRARRRLTHR